MTTTAGQNLILPFAQGAGAAANLETDAQYLVDALRLTGNIPDISRRTVNNKALLQATSIVSGLAQAVANRQSTNVTDAILPSAMANLILLGLGVSPTSLRTANYTVAVTDIGSTILANGAITITLPTSASVPNGFTFNLRNIGTGLVTVAAGSNTINGVAGNATLLAGNALILISDGVNGWFTANTGTTNGSVIQTNANVGAEIWYDTAGTFTYTKNNNTSFIVVTVVGGGQGATFNGGTGIPNPDGSSTTTATGQVGGASSFGSFMTAAGGAGYSNATCTGGDRNFSGQPARLVDYGVGTSSSNKTYVNLGVGDAGSGGGLPDTSGVVAVSGASGAAGIKKIATSALGATTTVTVGAGGTGALSNLLTNGGGGLVKIVEYT